MEGPIDRAGRQLLLKPIYQDIYCVIQLLIVASAADISIMNAETTTFEASNELRLYESRYPRRTDDNSKCQWLYMIY